jgi:hypothetical protein
LFSSFTYHIYFTWITYGTEHFYLFRWPGKKYVYICPPPSPKRTTSEVQEAKQAKKSGKILEEDADKADSKGVMYFEYDLMFHYLLASMRRADGANSVTAAGAKLFDILAGRGEHR